LGTEDILLAEMASTPQILEFISQEKQLAAPLFSTKIGFNASAYSQTRRSVAAMTQSCICIGYAVVGTLK
jgi:hypothetical protein